MKLLCLFFVLTSTAFAQFDSVKWRQQKDSAILASDNYLQDTTLLIRWNEKMSCEEIYQLRLLSIKQEKEDDAAELKRWIEVKYIPLAKIPRRKKK